AEITGPGAALLQRLQQFRVGGDAGTAADQLDGRALVDIGLPPDAPQEGSGKEARHRAADDDRAPGAAVARHFGARRPRHWMTLGLCEVVNKRLPASAA